MLKNTRNYLKEELIYVNKAIKEINSNQDAAINKYNTGKAFLEAVNEHREAQAELTGNILYDVFISLVYAALSHAFLASFTVPTVVIGLALLTYISIQIGKSIKKNREASEKLQIVETQIDKFPEDINSYENYINIILKHKIDQNQKALQYFEKEARVIWDILSNDDMVTKLEQYSKKYEAVSSALESEWDAYLEEIKNIDPKDIHLETSIISENDIKAATKVLSLNKKETKKEHHPLSC